MKKVNFLIVLVSQLLFFCGIDAKERLHPVFPTASALSPEIEGKTLSAETNYSDNTLSVFEMSRINGSRSELYSSPFSTGVGPVSVKFSPVSGDNLFAAVANTLSNNVTVYRVDSHTGEFIEVEGSPFSTGVQPSMAIFSPIMPGGLFAAVVNSAENSVSVYQVNQSTGTFTEIPGSPYAASSEAYHIEFYALEVGSSLAAINNDSSEISIYGMNQTVGSIKEITPITVSKEQKAMKLDHSFSTPINLFATVRNKDNDKMSVYQVNQVDGEFTQLIGWPFTWGPTTVTTYPPKEEEEKKESEPTPEVVEQRQEQQEQQQVANLAVPSIPLEPLNFTGVIKKDKFLNKTQYTLIARWDPSPSANIKAYRIYKNGVLTEVIPASSRLIFKKRVSSRHAAKDYKISAVNTDSGESSQLRLIITN